MSYLRKISLPQDLSLPQGSLLYFLLKVFLSELFIEV